jgi:hypothetical protein
LSIFQIFRFINQDIGKCFHSCERRLYMILE